MWTPLSANGLSIELGIELSIELSIKLSICHVLRLFSHHISCCCCCCFDEGALILSLRCRRSSRFDVKSDMGGMGLGLEELLGIANGIVDRAGSPPSTAPAVSATEEDPSLASAQRRSGVAAFLPRNIDLAQVSGGCSRTARGLLKRCSSPWHIDYSKSKQMSTEANDVAVAAEARNFKVFTLCWFALLSRPIHRRDRGKHAHEGLWRGFQGSSGDGGRAEYPQRESSRESRCTAGTSRPPEHPSPRAQQENAAGKEDGPLLSGNDIGYAGGSNGRWRDDKS